MVIFSTLGGVLKWIYFLAGKNLWGEMIMWIKSLKDYDPLLTPNISTYEYRKKSEI